MSQIGQAKRCSARLAWPLLAAAGVLALYSAAAALAQETGALRGGLATEGGRPGEEAPQQDLPYVAGSRGVPPEESLAPTNPFGGSMADAFADAPLPTARPADAPAASVRRDSDDAQDTQGAGAARVVSTERAAAAEPVNRRVKAIEGRDLEAEEDPYAPLGLRVGTFIVVPSLEQGVGWTSNASSSPGGSSAVLSETTLRLRAISDWSRHSAAIDAYGTFRETLSGENVSDPEAGVEASLVFDLAEDLRAAAAAGYEVTRESAASPVNLPPATSRPLRHTLTGSLGLEKDAGRFRFGATGNLERQQFGDAELEGGGELAQRDRDFVLTTAVLRGGYQISPALTPFVEGELGRRIYDLPLDASGYDRSATRVGIRAGLAIDLGEKFFGEVSAGWVGEDIDDARLEDISAASVSADLFWSPVRGTQVGLQAATVVEGATAPGESGSVLYTGGLSVERRMRANLTGSAALGIEWRDYVGADAYDLTLSVEAGMTYWFNRYAGLTGRARHERMESSAPGRDSKTSSVFLGVKLQR